MGKDRQKHHTPAQAADLLEVTTRTLRDWRAAGCPAEEEGTGRSKRVKLHLPSVIEWRISRAVEQERARWQAQIEEAGGDPSLAGNGSPWLEEYRKQRALAARRENDFADRRLVSVGELQQQLAVLALPIRSGIERLERAGLGEAGVRAVDILVSVLRAACEALSSDSQCREG